MPAHPLEKEYEVSEWDEVRGALPEFRVLYPAETYGVCTSDSMRARDFYSRMKLPKFLVDYELISAGEDPLRGVTLGRTEEGRIVMGVYQPDDSINYYIEKI